MRALGGAARGALVALICMVGLHMSFWPTMAAVVLAAVAHTASEAAA